MSLLTALNLPPPPRVPGSTSPTEAAPHKPKHHAHGAAPAARAPAKAAPKPSVQPAPQAAPVAPPEPLYDVVFGRHELKAVPLKEALKALTAEYLQLRGNCSAEMQAHGERMQRGAQSMGAAAVAMISEGLGRAKMPPLEIWDQAFAALDLSRSAMRKFAVPEAVQNLVEAQQHYAQAHAAVLAYDGKLEKGGDRAITGLKATAAVGAVAAGVATGGVATAAGLGTTATIGVGAASAGAYGATQELAGQASEVYLADTRKRIDWASVLRRGGTDFATGLIGGVLGGALTKQFSKLFGSYVGKAITDAELAELGKLLGMVGPLERTYFMTASQKFVAEFLSGAALVPVTSAITLAVNKISGGAPGPKNVAEFMEGVVADIAQGGLIQLFIAFLAHKMPPPPSKGGSSGKAPPAAGNEASAPHANAPGKKAPPGEHPTQATVKEPAAKGTGQEPAKRELSPQDVAALANALAQAVKPPPARTTSASPKAGTTAEPHAASQGGGVEPHAQTGGSSKGQELAGHADGGAKPPGKGGGKGKPGVGGGSEPPPLGELKRDKQDAHSFILSERNEPKPKPGGKPKLKPEDKGYVERNQRMNKLMAVQEGKTPGASLLNKKYCTSSAEAAVRKAVQAELDTGGFNGDAHGARSMVIDMKEPTGWVVDGNLKSQETTKVKVTIDTKGFWHFYPTT